MTAGEIATWGWLNRLAGTTLNTNIATCPTYSQVIATGKIAVSTAYQPNQLVTRSDCTKIVPANPYNIYCRLSRQPSGTTDYVEWYWYSTEVISAPVTIEAEAYVGRNLYWANTVTFYGTQTESYSVLIPPVGDFEIQIVAYSPDEYNGRGIVVFGGNA